MIKPIMLISGIILPPIMLSFEIVQADKTFTYLLYADLIMSIVFSIKEIVMYYYKRSCKPAV